MKDSSVSLSDEEFEKLFEVDNRREECRKCKEYGEKSVYRNGVSFKWCSNCGRPKFGIQYDKWREKWLKNS